MNLKYQYLVVAGGAWQSLWDQLDTTTMGFQSAPEHRAVLDRGKLTSSITHELLRRFRDEVLVIPRMTEEDYQELAKEVANTLPENLREVFSELCREYLNIAVKQRLGMRFFEEMVSKSFMRIRSMTVSNNKGRKEPLSIESL